MTAVRGGLGLTGWRPAPGWRANRGDVLWARPACGRALAGVLGIVIWVVVTGVAVAGEVGTGAAAGVGVGARAALAFALPLPAPLVVRTAPAFASGVPGP